MKTLILTVGLPRSGKTTWAREQGVPIVSPDAIRLAIHGAPYISRAEPFVWATARTMVAALFEAGHDTVVLDACNNSRNRRDEWKSSRWRRVFRVFDTLESVCIWRAHNTGREDILHVIKRMAQSHEPVANDEHEPEGRGQ